MKPLISLLLIPLLLGCATAGKNTFKFAEPTAYNLENSIFVNEPFEAVWSRLVARLSESFFVINNIEKDSLTLPPKSGPTVG